MEQKFVWKNYIFKLLVQIQVADAYFFASNFSKSQ